MQASKTTPFWKFNNTFTFSRAKQKNTREHTTSSKKVCTKVCVQGQVSLLNCSRFHWHRLIFRRFCSCDWGPVHVLGFCKKVQSSQGTELNCIARRTPSVFTAPNFFQLSKNCKKFTMLPAWNPYGSAEEHSKCVFESQLAPPLAWEGKLIHHGQIHLLEKHSHCTLLAPARYKAKKRAWGTKTSSGTFSQYSLLCRI